MSLNIFLNEALKIHIIVVSMRNLNSKSEKVRILFVCWNIETIYLTVRLHVTVH